MSLRCGCPDEADDIVFGPMHRCSVDPKPPADLPRFVPSWVFVVPEDPEPAGDLTDASDYGFEVRAQYETLRRDHPPTFAPASQESQPEGTYDPDLQEARIHQVLGEDETHD